MKASESPVILRLPRPGDAEILFPQIHKTTVTDSILWDGPNSLAEYSSALAERSTQTQTGEKHFFLIANASTDSPVGCIELRPENEWRGNIGLWVGAPHHGKGYGTHAVAQITRYGFEKVGLSKIEATAFVGNRASRRIFEKNGFLVEGTIRQCAKKRGRLVDEWMLGITREDWESHGRPPPPPPKTSTKDPVAEQLAEELREQHGAHTVILYGSRARGDATPASDYDLVGIAPIEQTLRVARKLENGFLDAFVMPEKSLADPTEAHLYMRGGRVIFEKDGFGAKFLARLDELAHKQPDPLPADEIAARLAWIPKMLERAKLGDPEGNFRRHWLLTAMLEDFFAIQRLRYEGPKKSLARLKEMNPALYALYSEALQPGATPETVESAGHSFRNYLNLNGK